jgi:TRIAP1/MDM35 family protein
VRAAFQAIQDLPDGMTSRTGQGKPWTSTNNSPKKAALKEKGIEDMIAEARADNKDNDIEYMKPCSGK